MLLVIGGVAEAVVDLGQAGGVGVAEVGDLDGCGFAGEEGQAVARRVAGQVDEDLDGVGGDRVGGVVVGEGGDVAPGVGVGAELVGECVVAGVVGVAEDFELIGVV